ncbi:addiction module antidote protein [Pseudorhodoferax sp.]|uniref:addiction module antidote protein n=1 Tax=Pseudorhodoferax sp. TaxID=1993553 RepID=UPI0039E5F943
MAELYRADPALVRETLNSILADGDPAELLIVLRKLVPVFGGAEAVAPRSGLAPAQLDHALASQGDLAFGDLAAILKGMGLRLVVQPAHAA